MFERNVVPADTRLSVSAGLYLQPLEISPYGDDKGPRPYIAHAKPSGFLGSFVSELGPVWGWLDLSDQGVRWRPRRRPARWGFREIELGWRQITGADLTFMYVARGGADDILMIETVDARIEFVVRRPDEGRIREVLAEYLEQPGPPIRGSGTPAF